MRFPSMLSMLSILALLACSNSTEPQPYSVSGSVVDADGQAVPGVTLDFGSFGTATSGLDGTWSKSGLQSTVTITPAKDQWAFAPGSMDVEQSATGIRFIGAPLQTMVEVVVSWDDIGQTAAGGSTSGTSATPLATGVLQPTDFGTRLEYPSDNAAFTQSVSRQQAQDYGLITLDVPPADSATLYVAAVQLADSSQGQPGQRDPIVWFGYVPHLEIVQGKATVVHMGDVVWTQPSWEFEDPAVRTAYDSGTMTAAKDSTALSFYIRVLDPFGDRPWDDFIGLDGTGGAVAPADSGSWRVVVQCRNDAVGTTHGSTCAFWPYLHSDMFHLPSVRFTVPPVTHPFTVQWQ